MTSAATGTTPASSLPAHWVDPNPAASAPTPRGLFGTNLKAFASVQFGDHSGPPPETRLDWTVHQVQDIIGRVQGRGALVYRLSVLVAALIAPLLIFRLPTLSRLDYEQRIHALERFERSPFGMMLFAIKALLCIVYYEHPEAAQGVGFDGTCMGERHDAPASAEVQP